MDYEDSLETITAMRHQEESAYQVTDYFQSMRQRLAQHTMCKCYDSDCSDTEGLSDSESSSYKSCSSTASESCSSCASSTAPSTSGKNPCDPSCRAIMFQWMVRLVDFFPSMHRETVAYAMDFLDRFLQTPSGRGALQRRSVFQLAAISCLYTAVKMHESAAVSPKFLEQLSRDEYTVRDVERMELCICGRSSGDCPLLRRLPFYDFISILFPTRCCTKMFVTKSMGWPNSRRNWLWAITNMWQSSPPLLPTLVS